MFDPARVRREDERPAGFVSDSCKIDCLLQLLMKETKSKSPSRINRVWGERVVVLACTFFICCEAMLHNGQMAQHLVCLSVLSVMSITFAWHLLPNT